MDTKLWEEKLKQALIISQQREIDLLEESELKGKDAYKFSKEFENKMQTLIDSLNNKENNKNNENSNKIVNLKPRKLSIKKKALIVVAAIVLIMSMVLTVEGNKETLIKIIMEIGRVMDRITFQQEEGILDTIREEYAPTYIPKEYILLEENKGKMIFQNENRDEIIFWQISPRGSSVSVDNEDVIKKEVKISSIQGTMVESLDKDRSIIYWNNGRYLFMITVYFRDEEELIKIAESVRIKEK